LLPARATGEVLSRHDDIGLASQAAIPEIGIELPKGVGREVLGVVALDQVEGRDDVVCVDIIAED